MMFETIALWSFRRRLRKCSRLLDKLSAAHDSYHGSEWFASVEYKRIVQQLDAWIAKQ